MKFVLWPNDRNRGSVLANCLAYINERPDDTGFDVIVKRHVKTKTNKQTAAIFGLAYPIVARSTGNDDVNEWHEFFLGERFGWVEEHFFEKKKRKPARTLTTGYDGEEDEISSAECAEFFDFIQRYCAQRGITIPDPDPLWKERRKKGHKED